MPQRGIVRVDSRLIHGQVLKAWVAHLGFSHILIVDDNLAQDGFLISIYKISVPQNCNLEIYDIEGLIEACGQRDILGEGYMVLFRSLDMLQLARERGFSLDALQVAGVGNDEGKTTVYEAVSLSEAEAVLLKQMQNEGIHVYFQSLPDRPAVELDTVLHQYFAAIVN